MTLRIMFIPVSSPKGVGEYMRSLALAETIREQNPEVEIRFILSAEAPYHKDCPFDVDLCASSPTKNSPQVKEYLSAFAPQVAIFDASGRASQLKHCSQNNIRTVFIAQHHKKLKKGLPRRRLKYTDQIWVVQPEFAMRPLSDWSRLKLKMLGKPNPDYIGPIFRSANDTTCKEVLDEFGLRKQQYILFNAGSGGHIVDGKNAAEEFGKAAAQLAEATKFKIVVIYGPNFTGEIPNTDELLSLKSIEQLKFNALLQHANVAVLGGGSALLQGISHGVNVVASAISGDQKERIDACTEQNLAYKTELDPSEIVKVVKKALEQEHTVDSSKVKNGLKQATLNLQKLLS